MVDDGHLILTKCSWHEKHELLLIEIIDYNDFFYYVTNQTFN
jgi:hypothetical protein